MKLNREINKRPYRKLQLSNYEQTENRLRYIKIRDGKKYQQKLVNTLAWETGFDCICSSCLQYKSKHLCKPLSSLPKAKVKKFTVGMCQLLKNRNNDQHVCTLCLKDINQNKIPKKSKMNTFQFAQ